LNKIKYYIGLHILKILLENKYLLFSKIYFVCTKDKNKIINELEKSIRKLNA
jgi:hypothetical protein